MCSVKDWGRGIGFQTLKSIGFQTLRSLNQCNCSRLEFLNNEIQEDYKIVHIAVSKGEYFRQVVLHTCVYWSHGVKYISTFS